MTNLSLFPVHFHQRGSVGSLKHLLFAKVILSIGSYIHHHIHHNHQKVIKTTIIIKL